MATKTSSNSYILYDEITPVKLNKGMCLFNSEKFKLTKKNGIIKLFDSNNNELTEYHYNTYENFFSYIINFFKYI
jgi:hypothetical protein